MKIEYLLDMLIRTIYWKKHICRIVDQTLLPVELKEIEITSPEQMFEAIKSLRVRGAPAIGIAGAIGIYLGIKDLSDITNKEFRNRIESLASYLSSSRPTAVNLFWALQQMEAVLERSAGEDTDTLCRLLLEEAHRIWREDREICRSIGRHGAELLPDSARVITHCNAGGLATADYGTALGVLYAAQEQGNDQ